MDRNEIRLRDFASARSLDSIPLDMVGDWVGNRAGDNGEGVGDIHGDAVDNRDPVVRLGLS